ncbi:MAG: kelch repeat-containing protein [Planctomycetota bacterium]
MSNFTTAVAPFALFALTAPAVAQTWSNTHPVAPGWTIRYAAAVAEQGGENQIFQFGGIDGLSSSDDVWRYHRTDGWFVMNDMPAGRHDSAAAKIELGSQDYIHLIGGGVGATSTTTTNWRYDPATDTWDTAGPAPMPVAKRGMEAVTAPNGRIYVFGGYNASGSVTYDSMHVYDPVTNSWSSGPTMPRPRRNFAAIKDCDGYIFLYGGNSTSSLPEPAVDCFNTNTGAWEATNPHNGDPLAPMLTPRSDIAGALGRNGRHYLTGGNIASPVAVPTVESYNPYDNTWNTEASLFESRNAHRVVGLGNRVWALGGYRKIWPTTNQLESFGSLGYVVACGDDVAPLPPPGFGLDFATAVALDFRPSITGGVIDPDHDHYFSVRLRPDVITVVDVDCEDQLICTVYDQNGQIVAEALARDGITLNTEGDMQGRHFIVLGGGIGSSAYDLFVNHSDDEKPIGQVYCTPAVPNSTGDPSSIRAIGLSSAAANQVELQVAGLPALTFGFFLVSPQSGNIANPGGSQGTLCLGGTQIGRYNASILNSGVDGEVALAIDTQLLPLNPVRAVQPGDRFYFSYWHRDFDPAIGQTSNFSDGVAIDFD